MTESQRQEKQQSLYKYYPAIEERYKLYTERLFVHNETYFSCPLDFNDPFDCRAYELTVDNPEEQQNIKIVKGKVDSILKNIGVLCLSAIKDNILMWSHYSTGHRGFCLEFKVTEDGYFEKAEKVIYPEKNEYPKIYIYERDEKKVKSILLYKSKNWEYEQERRIIISTIESRKIPFPKQLLTGVIFGCQMSDEDKQQIKEWNKEGNCSPKFYQANKKKNEFGLNILPD